MVAVTPADPSACEREKIVKWGKLQMTLVGGQCTVGHTTDICTECHFGQLALANVLGGRVPQHLKPPVKNELKKYFMENCNCLKKK